jgi:hypothetical protein
MSKSASLAPREDARPFAFAARPEINLIFQHALADGFYLGEIALLHPGDGADNLGARYRVKIREPFRANGLPS